MKKFFIVQWIGGERTYVKKTYCGRVISGWNKIDAKLFDEKSADKYLKKLQTINRFGEFEIRQLAR